jgi:hypothetical protein
MESYWQQTGKKRLTQPKLLPKILVANYWEKRMKEETVGNAMA